MKPFLTVVIPVYNVEKYLKILILALKNIILHTVEPISAINTPESPLWQTSNSNAVNNIIIIEFVIAFNEYPKLSPRPLAICLSVTSIISMIK